MERHAGNENAAKALETNDFQAMQKAARKYPLFVNDFFMKRVHCFMKEVMKEALGIDQCSDAMGRVDIAIATSSR